MASILIGSVTVATAATRVQFDPRPIALLSLRLVARTGITYVGDASVAAGARGVTLDPAGTARETIEFSPNRPGKLNEFWADAPANGNILDWFAVLLES